MKKVIKKIVKPEKTFEQWAFDNEVELPEYQPRFRKSFIIRWIAITAAAFILCFSAMLPFLLKNNALGKENPNSEYTPDTEPRLYLENEVSPMRITNINDKNELISFFNSNGMLFFNIEQIVDFQSLYSDIANDNNLLILSYHNNESFSISFKNDESRGFEVDYRIVIYENYRFMGHTFYYNLSPLFGNSGPDINYRIDNLSAGKAAFVKFSYDNCDYFLKIREIEGAGELNTESLRIFLDVLFE